MHGVAVGELFVAVYDGLCERIECFFECYLCEFSFPRLCDFSEKVVRSGADCGVVPHVGFVHGCVSLCDDVHKVHVAGVECDFEFGADGLCALVRLEADGSLGRSQRELCDHVFVSERALRDALHGGFSAEVVLRPCDEIEGVRAGVVRDVVEHGLDFA